MPVKTYKFEVTVRMKRHLIDTQEVKDEIKSYLQTCGFFIDHPLRFGTPECEYPTSVSVKRISVKKRG